MITCIGGVTLTADQKAKLQAFIDVAKPIEVKAYSNLDCSSDEHIPSGFQAIFDPKTPVDPTTISDNLFEVLAVSKVLEEGLDQSHFESRASAINASVDQFPEVAPGPAIRNPKTFKDTSAWAPELGGDGAFVGIYAKVHPDDHTEKDFYVVGRGSVPLLVQDLKKRIASSSSSVTYADLLDKEPWMNAMNNIQQTTRRNVFRTIANVAEAAEVTIKRSPDLLAFKAHPNYAPPEMANVDQEQITHTITQVAYEGRPAVMISYGIVPGDSLRDQFVVVANPFSGIHLFNMTVNNDLPVTTGRGGGGGTLKKVQGAAWEGVGGSIASHLAEFRPVDASFKATMKELGWDSERHVEKLLPVATKLNNPTLRRKIK